MTIPENYAMVPIDPTQEMIDAGNSVEPRVDLIWTAMLKAAVQTGAAAFGSEATKQSFAKQDVVREDTTPRPFVADEDEEIT